MKIFILIMSIVISFITVKYVKKIEEMECLVFELYVNDFEEYMLFNEEFLIEYDMVNLKKYFENKGYNFKINEGKINFKLSFFWCFYYEKEYRFYLEMNNENK